MSFICGEDSPEKIFFNVIGLKKDGDYEGIQNAVSRINGITDVDIIPEDSTIMVEYCPGSTTITEIKSTIQNCGLDVKIK